MAKSKASIRQGEIDAIVAALPEEMRERAQAIFIDEDRPEYEPLPPREIGGRPNIEYIRTRLRNVNLLNEWNLRVKGTLANGYQQSINGILTESRAMKFEDSQILSDTGLEDRTAAALRSLIEAQKTDQVLSVLLETSDDVLERMEKGHEDALTQTEKHLENFKGKDGAAEAEEWRTRRELGKGWLVRLRRLRRIRELARTPVPKGRLPFSREAYAACWFLRLAVYVMRSDEPPPRGQKREVGAVLDVPNHACFAAASLWKGRGGYQWRTPGTREEFTTRPDLFDVKGGWMPGKDEEAKIFVLICPPRHMKTTIGAAYLTANFVKDQRRQLVMLHAVEEKSKENYGMIRSNFRQTESAGRRMHALFPSIALETANDSETRFKVEHRTKNPQMTYYGVRQAAGGANIDDSWWDDIVDKKQADNEDERERLKNLVMQVFYPRLQGDGWFLLVTATPWNVEDTVWSLKKQIEANKLAGVVCIMPAGGPKSTPKFKPLWKERRPAAWLEDKFHAIQNHRDYMAQYGCDPQPDEARIVKALAYYVVEFDEGVTPTDCHVDCGVCHVCQMRQHAEFLRAATFHLSLDPAATAKDDKKRHTDRAGLIYAANGDIVRRRPMSGGGTIEDRFARVRFIDATAVYAGPAEGIAEVKNWALSRKVNCVHIEKVGFSTAIIENLRNSTGLGANNIFGHGTSNLSKIQRLKTVSGMLDDSQRAMGLAPPVVEFPGIVMADGSVKIVPRLAWLERQILNAGQTGENHCLDAATQLLRHLSPEMGVGEGAFSQAVAAEVEKSPDERRREALSEYYNSEDESERDVVDEEVRFIINSSRPGAW